MVRIGFAFLLSAGAATAQERISPDAFLDLAVGNTLTFSRFYTGDVVGVEQFLSRDRSVWVEADGTCMYGRIWTKDDQLCFTYDLIPDLPQCWYMFQKADRLFAVFADTSSIQEVTEISDQPLECTEAPIAQNMGANVQIVRF